MGYQISYFVRDSQTLFHTPVSSIFGLPQKVVNCGVMCRATKLHSGYCFETIKKMKLDLELCCKPGPTQPLHHRRISWSPIQILAELNIA